jgi:Tol biopolymer transport system component
MLGYRRAAGTRTQLTWFDRTGKVAGTVGDPDENSFGYPELSPDGRRLAVDRIVQGNQDIWLIDLQRPGATRFTFDAAADIRPEWSADGTQILFSSNRKNSYDLYAKPTSGTGAEQLLLESAESKFAFNWSGANFLLYVATDPRGPLGLSVLPMQGDRKPVSILNSPFI